MLPDLDGFEVQRRLRGDGDRVPVLFLTARDQTEDQVRGLTLGGDDYVTKPFSLEELVARVRAVLRRTGARARAEPARVRGARARRGHSQVWRGGRAIDLTPTEFKLLRYLMRNAQRVLSKAQILDHVWEYDFGGDPQRRRDLHQLPAPQARRRPPVVDPHGSGHGYCLRPRVSVRCRCGLAWPCSRWPRSPSHWW